MFSRVLWEKVEELKYSVNFRCIHTSLSNFLSLRLLKKNFKFLVDSSSDQIYTILVIMCSSHSVTVSQKRTRTISLYKKETRRIKEKYSQSQESREIK